MGPVWKLLCAVTTRFFSWHNYTFLPEWRMRLKRKTSTMVRSDIKEMTATLFKRISSIVNGWFRTVGRTQRRGTKPPILGASFFFPLNLFQTPFQQVFTSLIKYLAAKEMQLFFSEEETSENKQNKKHTNPLLLHIACPWQSNLISKLLAFLKSDYS